MATQYLDTGSVALAKMYAPGESARFLGTAFAVGSDRVITSFHCIGNIQTQTVAHARVRFEFVTGFNCEADLQRFDADHDFAEFQLADERLAGTALFPLVRGTKPFTEYRAFGFPTVVTLFAVTTVSGTVSNPTATLQNGARALQLYCKEIDGGLDLRGLSGGPVLVVHQGREAVVGIVRQLQQRSADDPLAVGSFFAACPIKAVLDACPDLEKYAIDRASTQTVATLMTKSVDDQPPAAVSASASAWTPKTKPELIDITFAPARQPSRALRRLDTVYFKLAAEIQWNWKDPLIESFLGYDERGTPIALTDPMVAIGDARMPLRGQIQCIPGFGVDVEWREATHVGGSLWGPIKLRSVREFIAASTGKVLRGRIVRIAPLDAREKSAPKKPDKSEQTQRVKVLVQCDAYDRWLDREWAYYKALEAALTRNSLYQSDDALELRQAGHLLALATQLIADGRLYSMIPERYRYLLGDRKLDPQDAEIVLEGLIDQFQLRADTMELPNKKTRRPVR